MEEDTQPVGDLYLEGARAWAAYVGAVAVGSCCSRAEDTSGASLVAGRRKEEGGLEGLEAVPRAADRHEGGTAVLGVRSWAA